MVVVVLVVLVEIVPVVVTGGGSSIMYNKHISSNSGSRCSRTAVSVLTHLAAAVMADFHLFC